MPEEVPSARGLPGAGLQAAQRQLLSSFASHLGNVFEMAQIRHKLLRAEAARESAVDRYREEGVELLKLCPRCGACQPAAQERCEADGSEMEMPLYLPLRLLGRYRFLRRLGEGGMGIVLEAEDEQLDRQVAIKFMRPGHFHDAAARVRFEREIHTLALMDHPGIVKVYDSGELVDGAPYVIMERLRGRHLREVIRDFGPGTPAQVARLLRQGAGALAAAHSLRVVHRDVKPEHLFLTPGPDGFHTRILDFGLAKPLSSPSHLTRTGALVGTPLYMSPEQVMGRDVDERTDTFAFASAIYEALLGSPPVRATALAEIISAIHEDSPLPPSHLAPWLPPEIDDAFSAALAKEPARRPDNLHLWAGTLAGQLESIHSRWAGWPDSALLRGNLASPAPSVSASASTVRREGSL